MDLRCRKLDCKFNNHYTCKAKNLAVSKNAVCQIYENDSSKPDADKVVSIFEKTPKFAPQRDTKSIKIECCAKCLLNKEGICEANGITINDYRGRPYCQTFIKK